MLMLNTSDWHPDKRTMNYPRFDDVAQAVEQTVDVAIAEKVDLYAFNGDLCDPDAGPIVLRCAGLAVRASARLSSHGIQSVWVAGNHDVFEDGSGLTSLNPLHGMPGIVTVAERPTLFEEFGMNILCLPYSAVSHAYDPEEWARKALEGSPAPKVLVLAHLHVKGIVPGEETREMGRGRELWFPREVFRGKEDRVAMFNGHYHAGGIHDGIVIPGSLARFTFGEESSKPSFLLVEL